MDHRKLKKNQEELHNVVDHKFLCQDKRPTDIFSCYEIMTKLNLTINIYASRRQVEYNSL